MKKPKKISQLNIHLTPETSQALFETEAATHMPPQVIAQGLFAAFVEHWRTAKSLTLPFHLAAEETQEFRADATGATAKVSKK